MFDLNSSEWLQVPNPYTPLRSDMLTSKLPMFLATSSISIEGHGMIAMLRQGKPIANARHENELIQKFALDLFGIGESEGNSSRSS
jgi:hypothetical protein